MVARTPPSTDMLNGNKSNERSINTGFHHQPRMGIVSIMPIHHSMLSKQQRRHEVRTDRFSQAIEN